MTDEGGTALLDPLNEAQQALVEIVGTVFANEPGTWPTFDYVDGELEEKGVDARDTIVSFPTMMVPGGYCAVWTESGWNTWPGPEQRVALTVVGMHHCEELRQRFPRSFDFELDLVRGFFALIDLAAEQRRAVPRSPTTVRKTEIESGPILSALQSRGYYFDRLPPIVLSEMMSREPPLWGGGSVSADKTTWTQNVTRRVNDFERISTIEEYVARLALMRPPPPRVPLAAPSPLGLVTAMDYLDTVWQLAYGKHLFSHESAERTAKLSHSAQTSDEFTARLSALGEVLRGARAALPKPRAKDTQQRPLRSLERYLASQLGAESEARLEANIHTLENVLFVRDHGQHTAAGTRAATALGEFGIGFPPGNWAMAWETVQAQAVEALGAIREELQAHLASASATT